MTPLRVVIATIVILATAALFALPDLLRGAGGENLREIQVSRPAEADVARERIRSGGDRSSTERAAGEDRSGGPRKSSTDGRRDRGSAGSDTGPRASAPVAQSSGSASTAGSSGGYTGGGGGSGGGGGGGGGEVVGDQPTVVGPPPAQPAPPAADDDVDDVEDDDLDVVEDEPEAEVDDG